MQSRSEILPRVEVLVVVGESAALARGSSVGRGPAAVHFEAIPPEDVAHLGLGCLVSSRHFPPALVCTYLVEEYLALVVSI